MVILRCVIRKFLAVGLCAISLQSLADPEYRFNLPPSKLEITLPAREANSVEVLKQAPHRSAVLIGSLAIKAEAGQSPEEVVEFAKRLASERGADFIIVSERSGPRTLHYSAPMGGHGGSGVQARRSMNALGTADMLYVGLGAVPKAALGLEFTNPMITGGRFVVQGFKAASKAAEAGVAVGDEVVLIAGVPIDTRDARYEKFRLTAQPGQVVQVTLRRDGNDRVVDVPLVANEE